MKKLDEQLRSTPEREQVWMDAFRKARQGWWRYHLALDWFAYHDDADQHTAAILHDADARLTEALQTLATAGLHDGELASLIRRTMIHIGELVSRIRKPVVLWDEGG